MALTKGQISRPMEQNRKPKNKYLPAQLILDKGARPFIEERTVFSKLLGKLDIHMQNNKVGPLLHTI
jgi:hypothetical protein